MADTYVPQMGTPPASSTDVVPTPMGWLPPDRAAALASSVANLAPSRRDVANALGMPVDLSAWLLRKMGVPIPGEYREADAIERTMGDGQLHTWWPSVSVPFSAQFFDSALANAPSWSDLYGALRKPGPGLF